jgi:hypothetical protein
MPPPGAGIPKQRPRVKKPPDNVVVDPHIEPKRHPPVSALGFVRSFSNWAHI